jgi:fluoride exporter
MYKAIILVGIGGFFGSILRFVISYHFGAKTLSSFPYGTFIVNILGSFIVGILLALTLDDLAGPESRLLLATGFCGGFTTFSTFSYEFFAMLQDGQTEMALFYISLTLVSGLLAVWAGFLVIKLLTP